MKLLENIVTSVPREKIHPDAEWFMQDPCDGLVKSTSDKTKPYIDDCEMYWTCNHVCEKHGRQLSSDDAATTVITRDELMRAYDLVEQGYTLWFGGERPITERDVYVITKNVNHPVRQILPRVFDWSVNAKDPIIAYKIAEPAKGVKYDSGKPRFSLLPLKQVWQVVEVLEAGAKKYAPDNWQKVDNQRERYFNAAQRHLAAWWQGEKKDPETGLSHLAHVACCVLFLMWGDDDTSSR